MKLTSKQLKVVKSLIVDIDELSNKPRRLFYALEEFAIAFDVRHAIPSLRTAQDDVYSNLNYGDEYANLFTSLRKFKESEWKWEIENSPDDKASQEKVENGICAVERFIKLHINSICQDWR